MFSSCLGPSAPGSATGRSVAPTPGLIKAWTRYSVSFPVRRSGRENVVNAVYAFRLRYAARGKQGFSGGDSGNPVMRDARGGGNDSGDSASGGVIFPFPGKRDRSFIGAVEKGPLKGNPPYPPLSGGYKKAMRLRRTEGVLLFLAPLTRGVGGVAFVSSLEIDHRRNDERNRTASQGQVATCPYRKRVSSP